MDEKLKTIKDCQNYWDIALTTTLVASVTAVIYVLVFHIAPNQSIANVIIYSSIGFVAAYPILIILGGLDKLVRRRIFKSYYIEDHGDVIKLIGSVTASEMTHAYKDILGIRSGYKIAKNSFQDYGCTIAAVRAAGNDLEARKKLEAMGFKVNTIG